MPRIRHNPSAALIPTALGLSIRSDLATFQLGGADAGVFLERVAPLLDGTRDRDAVIAALGGYSPASLAALLDALEARGLVEPVPADPGPAPRRGQEELFRAFGRDPADLSRRLAAARVLVVGRAPWCAVAAGELAAAGAGAVRRAGDDSALEAEAAAPWDLVVAAVAPESTARLERIARFAHGAGVRSLWAHLGGTAAVVGPLVVPGETACRLCATAEALNPSLAARGETAGDSAASRPGGAARARGGDGGAQAALGVRAGHAGGARGDPGPGDAGVDAAHAGAGAVVPGLRGSVGEPGESPLDVPRGRP